MKLLDDCLASRAFLLGDAFSLCDCVVASVVTAGTMMGKLPVDEKNVQAWIGKCTSRPALAKAMADA